jgi:hypothetical protein
MPNFKTATAGTARAVQFVAAPGREEALLVVAAQLERARGWLRPSQRTLPDNSKSRPRDAEWTRGTQSGPAGRRVDPRDAEWTRGTQSGPAGRRVDPRDAEWTRGTWTRGTEESTRGTWAHDGKESAGGA